VIDLFAQNQLNHQTDVQGGVLAAEGGALLQTFFSERRAAQRDAARLNHPLQDIALRTPDAAFEDLLAYPWQAHYLSDLPTLGGLRMHYLDESGASKPTCALTFLCLHDSGRWSYMYSPLIPAILAAGQRVVAPDMIGFGKSDKPKKEAFHHLEFHTQTLLELIERLDLQNIVLVMPQGSHWPVLSLPMAAPLRYLGLLRLDLAASLADELACKAPFPDTGHEAALRAFSRLFAKPVDAEAKNAWRGQNFSSLAEALGLAKSS
jgi:tRNA(adenine34) deaminase